MEMIEMLKVLSVANAQAVRAVAFDDETRADAAKIVAEVRGGGERAVRFYAERFGDVAPGNPLWLGRSELETAAAQVDAETIALLERTRDRIGGFASAQRNALSDVVVDVPGGRAGHKVTPLATAGCYAPGGRFPLPSSVLMTAVTARAAGVETVWVASPRPAPATVAAAAVAGADGLLCVGGAQAIAALAYGCGPIPPSDVVVGPGNKWVTAAKSAVSVDTRIDMLAGPSELLVIADRTACPQTIAADLLAQAEHDPDAIPMLVSTSADLIEEVSSALADQLAVLPTAETARAALTNGFAVKVGSLDEAVALSDQIAAEHLQVLTVDAPAVARRCTRYGGLFVGNASAEVFGDYGAGPNHTLPTGGTAKATGGLSVFDFLSVRTWLELENPAALLHDTVALARLEGLEGHARAALARTH